MFKLITKLTWFMVIYYLTFIVVDFWHFMVIRRLATFKVIMITISFSFLLALTGDATTILFLLYC